MRIGAAYLGDSTCEFTVWAPTQPQISIQLTAPQAREISLEPQADGYWQAIANDVPPGARYTVLLGNGTAVPDPASRYQPEGVHQPSQVIDPAFAWGDGSWRNVPQASLIVYELHVGTFTPEGTFAAIIPRLGDLKTLGINAIEIMPISQVPGDSAKGTNLAYRNWGYDGVYSYAVQCSYGTPDDLKRLINACHKQGIAVLLDVVYNHFGPEGNYSNQIAPYFTQIYNTPWGNAMNFDDAYSDGVRNFFVQNALYWLREFHFDGLRLDAIQTIYDFGARPVLQELADEVAALSKETQRPYYLIAESDLNDARILRPAEQGGYGLNGQWSDDFHHSLHRLLTGEHDGYYQDFDDCVDFAKAYEQTYAYDWRFSVYRQRKHGMPCGDRPLEQFVVCSQNHDQVGNRMKGDRLSQLVSFDGLKLAAGAVLLSPYIPLLFMGEEYGETAPFPYFISHSDPDLVDAVRKGRKREFAAFQKEGEPADAASVETFLHSKLNWSLRHQDHHESLLQWYQRLIQLRTTHPLLQGRDRTRLRATGDNQKRTVVVQRGRDAHSLFLVMNFNAQSVSLTLSTTHPASKRLDSAEPQWHGVGSRAPAQLDPQQSVQIAPLSLVLYETTA